MASLAERFATAIIPDVVFRVRVHNFLEWC
jgi:hypothetical protein